MALRLERLPCPGEKLLHARERGCGRGGLAAQLAQLPDEVVARPGRSDQPHARPMVSCRRLRDDDAGAAQAAALIARQAECARVRIGPVLTTMSP
jgi:hypothetical protein